MEPLPASPSRPSTGGRSRQRGLPSAAAGDPNEPSVEPGAPLSAPPVKPLDGESLKSPGRRVRVRGTAGLTIPALASTLNNENQPGNTSNPTAPASAITTMSSRRARARQGAAETLTSPTSDMNTNLIGSPRPPTGDKSGNSPKTMRSMAVAATAFRRRKRSEPTESRAEVEKKKQLDELKELEVLAEKLNMNLEPGLDLVKAESREIKFQQAESKLFYYPDTREAAKNYLGLQKTTDRNFRDDGIHTGEYTDTIPWFNWARMDHRLKTCEPNQGQAWLGADGRMLAHPDPLILQPSRQTYTIAYHAAMDESLDIIKNEAVTELESFPIPVDLNQKPGSLLQVHIPGHEKEDSAQLEEKTMIRLSFALHDITLHDHVLMSEESRVAGSIERMVADLDRKKGLLKAEALERKLLAIYEDYRRFQDRLPGDVSIDLEEQRYTYLVAILDAQKQFETYSREERLTEWQVLKAWAKLKEIRSIQKYTSTTLKVLVKKLETDEQMEQRKLDAYVKMVVEVRMALMEMEYARKMRDYEREMNAWNERQGLKKELAESLGELEEDKEEMEATEVDPDKPRRRRRKQSSKKQEEGRPQEPPALNIDAAKIEQELMADLLVCFRKPGSPIMSILVAKSDAITPSPACPKMEQLRRSQITATSFYLKIFISDRQVVNTCAVPLTLETFKVSFRDTEFARFAIQLQRNPSSFRAELWEKGINHDAKVATLPMEYPDISKVAGTIDLEVTECLFEGTTIPANVSNNFDYYFQIVPTVPASGAEMRNVTGRLRVTTAWDVDEKGHVLAPKKSWVAGHKLPTRAAKFESDLQLKSKGAPKQQLMNETGKVFRLNTLEKEDLDLPITEISKRNELLRLRNEKKIFTKQPVPISDMDITKDVYELKEEHLDEARLIDPSLRKTQSYSVLRTPTGTASSAFLKRVRTHQLYKLVRSQQFTTPHTFESFVREEKLAEATESSFLAELLKPHRPLNPARKNRVGAAAKAVIPESKECNVLAQIVRGYNIPVRASSDSIARNSPTPYPADNDDGLGERKRFKKSTVRPYVEVQFQHKKNRTSVASGPNPHWNETLTLPFRPPNGDFRPETLQNVRDNIYFNIFDETVVDLVQDDRDRGTVIHQRKDRTWLGTLAVPFSTVYQHLVISGQFHVKTPLILTGYERSDPEDYQTGVNTDETMLSLFITLEPALQQPPIVRPNFESHEDPEVLRSIQRWRKNMPFDRVNITATAIDLTGKTVLACRFIRQQAPPAGMDTVDKVLAFVSMIPFLEDRTTLAASIELWSTADQMLEIGAGDEAEHAILFCNYLLDMGKNAYVVLGKGIPEGKAAYVLVEDDPKVNEGNDQEGAISRLSAWHYQRAQTRMKLFNPLSGAIYLPSDSHCPLLEISCVFNQENIWANLQEFMDPARVRFDFNDPLLWKPLFANTTPRKQTSVQMETLKYLPPSEDDVENLRYEIYEALRSKIEKFRGRNLTKWNRAVGRILESILPFLEENRQTGQIELGKTVMSDLNRVQSTYHIVGFPLNCALTDVDAIVEAVYNTDVHSNQDESAEFALGVHVYPYVNGVFSVWVYAASLTKKTALPTLASKSMTLSRRLTGL